jgi:hypothetical protein
MSAEVFAAIATGDYVREQDRAGRPTETTFRVLEVTAKRFTCEIGWNEYIKQPMRRTYRKLDGRSVGGRIVHWVMPVNFPNAAAMP